MECWEIEAETDEMCDGNLGVMYKEGELIFEGQGLMDQLINEKYVGKDMREMFNS